MIIRALDNAVEVAKQRQWEKTYWALDVHDTILKPNWDSNEIPKEFYPVAKQVLQILTKREDVVMMLYTCSHPNSTDKYVEYFQSHQIIFDYVNENPEVINDDLGYYDRKPYFNVLIDDKAGFDPIIDWPLILEWLEKKGNSSEYSLS